MRQWLAGLLFLAVFFGAQELHAQMPLDQLRAKAEAGDSDSQLLLGMDYFNGLQGVATNQTEAEVWFRKAAEQGNASAQFNLGTQYNYGVGVSKDATEALKWIRKAADQGLAQAEYVLGLAYAQGAGVPKNASEALKWFRKAADQGVAQAEYVVGLAYDQGDGVPKDAAEAEKWIRKAAAQGEPFARQYVDGLNYTGVVTQVFRATWNPWSIGVICMLAPLLWFFSRKVRVAPQL